MGTIRKIWGAICEWYVCRREAQARREAEARARVRDWTAKPSDPASTNGVRR